MLNRHRIAILALSVAGLIVAIIHALQENLYIPPNFCNINSKISCGGLFNSGYTAIQGVPFWLLGLIWFVMLIPVGFLLSDRWKILIPVLMVGNLFTIYLWNIEINIVGIICPVCVSLYAVNYAITGVAYFGRSK
ncbi:MAG: vitamin K epoxide reductase family protein [Nitrososphaerota archaeon]|jgi:uncharacterized membrane protein|nr:vitamin K epoxide reductase family protein [Nitrososphaerota archaeon]